MTRVLDRGGNGPGAHALVIGVGRYPWMSDGENFDPLNPALDLLKHMKQLSSPPVSALGFARWLVEQPLRPHKGRLETVDLLLSANEALDMPADWVPEAATLDNIRNAFGRWYHACNAHEDNTAIFYFCGHGLEKIHQYLLAEDFGRSELRPWENAFNMSMTHMAMARCNAKVQCYFIDACRQVGPELLESASIDAVPLMSASLMGHKPGQDRTMVLATGHGQRAFGMNAKVARFTNALLQTLGGLGALRKERGRWPVQTKDICWTINQLLERETDRHGLPTQTAELTGVVNMGIINLLPDAPQTQVTIYTEPRERLGMTPLFVRKGDCAHDREARPEPWELELQAGYGYQIGIGRGGEERIIESEGYVAPPFTEFELYVEESA